jgi:hypothetical protein
VIVTVIGTPPCGTIPNAPTGLIVIVSGLSITLNCTAPAGGCAPTTYIIEAGATPGAVNLANFSTGNAATSYSATNVAAGTYFVRIRAANVNGPSSATSNEIVVTTVNPPPVLRPVITFTPAAVVAGVSTYVLTVTNLTPNAQVHLVFTLPDGSALGVDGVADVSGKFTESGTWTRTRAGIWSVFAVNDSLSPSQVSNVVTFTVLPGPQLTFSPTTLVPGVTPYVLTVTNLTPNARVHLVFILPNGGGLGEDGVADSLGRFTLSGTWTRTPTGSWSVFAVNDSLTPGPASNVVNFSVTAPPSITVTAPAVVPFSGAPIPGAPGCTPNTWFYSVTITNTSAPASVTITRVVDRFDGVIANDVTRNLFIAPFESRTEAYAWCSTSSAHTVQSTFSGVDARGIPVTMSSPLITLLAKP